jgi:hypothetical protein
MSNDLMSKEKSVRQTFLLEISHLDFNDRDVRIRLYQLRK